VFGATRSRSLICWAPPEASSGGRISIEDQSSEVESTWEDLGFRRWFGQQLKSHQMHLQGVDGSKPADFSNRDLRGWDFSKFGSGLPLKGFKGVGACFASAKLPGADLSHAKLALSDLEGADLSGADLSYADLRGARLDGANLSGARLDGVNLGPANLKTDRRTSSRDMDAGSHAAAMKEADLSGAKLRKATLTGCDLTGSVFRGADLSGADMAHAVIDDCEFEDAHGAEDALSAVNTAISGGQSLGDRIAAHKLFIESGGASGACLSLRGETIQSQSFARLDLGHARFIDCVVKDCDFSEATLDQADFAGSKMANCKFVAIEAAGVSFRRVQFEGCNFARAQIGVLALGTGVAAQSDHKLLSSFEGAKLLNCTFGSDRDSAALRQPELRNVSADPRTVGSFKAVGIPVPVLRKFTVVQS